MEFSRRLTQKPETGIAEIIAQLAVIQEETQEMLSRLEVVIEETEERITALEAGE